MDKNSVDRISDTREVTTIWPGRTDGNYEQQQQESLMMRGCGVRSQKESEDNLFMKIEAKKDDSSVPLTKLIDNESLSVIF